MRTRLAFLACAALLSIVPTASLPAQPIGSLIGREARPEDTEQIARRFASCYVGRQYELVQEWLETLPGSPAEERLMGRLRPDFTTCVERLRTVVTGIRFTATGMRQRIAEAMLRRHFPVLPDALPQSASGQLWTDRLIAGDSRQKFNPTAVFAAEMGSCVAKANWRSSVAMLAAEPGSAEERAAMRALAPNVPGCVTLGQRLTIDRPQLRAALAEAVYHLMADAASAGPQTAARQ